MSLIWNENNNTVSISFSSFQEMLNWAKNIGEDMNIPYGIWELEEWEQKVCMFAFQKHEGQKDDAGKDYFSSHILQVVSLIKVVSNDSLAVSLAYLHDTLEDTQTTYEELTDTFGVQLADLVRELTKEGQEFPNLRSKTAVIVKFADRLSNLSRMEPWTPERQQRYIDKSSFWKGICKC